MTKTKKDPRPLPARLWTFQRERAPLYGVLIMATTTVGVAYNFSSQSWRNYFVAVMIISLYLVQIRTADEKKDFEHDNKYHPNRPVQRGVVSLSELAVINKLSIVGQLLLYASFLDPRIFLLGIFSQSYAFLTRKEFFVREWIRQHFFVYYFSHYIQLVILFYAMVSIVQPSSENYWSFVTLFMFSVIATEIGRKMLAVEDDTIDDTYSAQLGHKGSAVALSLISLSIVAIVYYFLDAHSQNYLFIIAPMLVFGLIVNAAYHYALEPNRKNANLVEQGTGVLYVVAMLTVILGT
jgi:4-hydroxybenzoate polyprenyltransferase